MALVIQFEEAVENLVARCLADRPPNSLIRFVETVIEVKIGPTVSIANGPVQVGVQIAERTIFDSDYRRSCERRL